MKGTGYMDTEPLRRSTHRQPGSVPPPPTTWDTYQPPQTPPQWAGRHAVGQPRTPPVPTPPDPYISSVNTARNTARLARDIAAIKWIMLLTLICIVMVFICAIVLATKIDHIVSYPTYSG